MNYFLPQNIISCPKKLFHVTRNYCFLLEIDYLFCIWFSVTLFAWEKESNSCHMKYILVTGNKFLSKETNSSLKNLLSLVKLSLLPSGISTIFAWAYTLCGNRFPGSPWICRPAPNRVQIQGVPKKRGISECYSICFTARLIWNLENSFLIHLKIDIHMF